MASERGSMTVLAAASAAILTVMFAVLGAVFHVHVVRTQLQATADIAALSAGPRLADGCQIAAAVAAQNTAQLVDCERTGLAVQVRVSRSVLGYQLLAVARAAPASSFSTVSAPALSSGALPLPHFGEITQRGQPAVQGHAAMR